MGIEKNALNAGSFYSLSGSGGNQRLIFAPPAIQKSHYGGLKTTNEGIKCQFCGQQLYARFGSKATIEFDNGRRTEWNWTADCRECGVHYFLSAHHSKFNHPECGDND